MTHGSSVEAKTRSRASGGVFPAALIELRISAGKKLGRHPTTADRLAFGRELVEAMAEAAGVTRGPTGQ